MRGARLLLLLTLTLLLPSCVYESDVPLGTSADAPFDPALLGSWMPTGEDPADDVIDARLLAIFDTADLLPRVVRFNTHEYAISWMMEIGPFGRDGVGVGQKLMLTRVFITPVEDVAFLNLQDVDDEDGRYYFARYSVQGDTLRLRFIAEHEEDRTPAPWEAAKPRDVSSVQRGMRGRFETSAELRAAVAARRHDPLLYEQDEYVFVRWPPRELVTSRPPRS